MVRSVKRQWLEMLHQAWGKTVLHQNNSDLPISWPLYRPWSHRSLQILSSPHRPIRHHALWYRSTNALPGLSCFVIHILGDREISASLYLPATTCDGRQNDRECDLSHESFANSFPCERLLDAIKQANFWQRSQLYRLLDLRDAFRPQYLQLYGI